MGTVTMSAGGLTREARPLAKRRLGKTELDVFPIGLGGGGYITRDDALYAVDAGVNYLFHSSDLHHFAYGGVAGAIKELCRIGSARRAGIVLATVTYLNATDDPNKLIAVLFDQLKELGTDYIDVFHFGWITDRSPCEQLFSARTELCSDGPLTRTVRLFTERKEIEQAVGDQLVRRGFVRYVGASFHSRAMAAQHHRSLDVLMLRYNIAHRGIETEVLPLLDEDTRPGVVAFNVAHEGGQLFSTRPQGYPPAWPLPSVGDCYRFALAQPQIDLVLAGLSNRAQVDAAMRALAAGHLSEDEWQFMAKYGDFVRRRRLIESGGHSH